MDVPVATASPASPSGLEFRRAMDGAPGFGVLLAVVRRRRLPLTATTLLVPLLAWLALGQMTPRFSAVATVLYEPNAFAVRELQSILRADPTTEAVMSSQAEIVRGLTIAERVANQLHLAEIPEFNTSLRPLGLVQRGLKQVSALFGVAKPAVAADVEDARSAVILAVRDATSVAIAKSSRVLEITFTSQDRRLAAAAANLIADLYIRDQLDVKFAAVRHATDWLETRVVELRRDVGKAEDRVAAYRASRGLAKGVLAGLNTEQVSRLSADLAQARNEMAQVQARLDAARGRTGAAAQAAIAPSVTLLRSQQEVLGAQLQSTLARQGPRHPESLALQSQYAEASRSVAAEIARVVAAAAAELRADRERVASLEAALRAATATQDSNDQAQVPLNALERDSEASRTLLQSVLERVQQTVQQNAIETPDARLISAALPPSQPSFPRAAPLLAGAVVFGLFFGLLLAYLLELADATFRSGEDVRSLLGLPCFALVPEIPSDALRRYHIGDYIAHKPLSPFAEQLRALRAGLWLGSGAGGAVRPRIIAITAARPAEGKTTVALALARAAAMAGERVALVDCDIREPGLGRLLKSDGNLGLVDCLLGHAALPDVIGRDTLTNLDFIPAGASEIHSLGLLMSDAMAEVLQALRGEYDLVLLDAPPVFAMADARVLARLADATLLCLRWRSTPRAVIRDALDLLSDAQANLVGVVLTRVDVRAHLRSGFADAEVYHPRYGGYARP
jgi:succinoglycan biosynthesis transport protein ExoP